MKSWIALLIVAVLACLVSAHEAPAAGPSCASCRSGSCPPVYARTYRGAALAQRRAQTGLYFRWLPGDAFRGRGVIFLPSQPSPSHR